MTMRRRDVLIRATALGALGCAAALPAPARAQSARVAIAANFADAARAIGEAFERSTGHSLALSVGSTGQLYAQIAQGAPFDVFLAADRERPRRAVEEGLAVAGSRFTYAIGRLVLFSADDDLVRGEATLRDGAFTRIAVANPATAPYGAAAIETLRALGVHDRIAPRLVRGNSVAQAYQFVATRNAELGFVAFSQIARVEHGSRWLVPASLHAPIAQDAVLLERGVGNEAARAFLAFLRGPAAGAIKERFGYPDGD